MNEDIVVPMMFFITVTLIGFPFAVAIALRMLRKGVPPKNALPTEVSERLERMEQAIDSIAVEVERISEGQRFTTKLLSERAGSDAPAALPPREPRA
jgi:hypothetical protein